MRRRAKQRGTAYVLVLSITTLLVVLGLTSTLIARSTLQRTELEADQAKARLLGITFMDYCHSRIDGSAFFRMLVQSGEWRSAEPFGDGTARHMYLDEIDGDMNDGNAHPFRLYVMVTVGDAVRVYSQEFIPDDSNNLRRDPKTFRQETVDGLGL